MWSGKFCVADICLIFGIVRYSNQLKTIGLESVTEMGQTWSLHIGSQTSATFQSSDPDSFHLADV